MAVSQLTEPPPSPPTFDALPLSAEVRRAVDELGYTHPTPVQRACYEPTARGDDLVVQARTGTGKTAAFGLPIVDTVVKKTNAHPQVLVLCPTRELALQITRELQALSKYRGIKVVAVYGGAPMGRQVDEINQGAQVIVGTPGRVLDHLRRKTLDPKTVRTFVLDESDEMLSMGFLPQITEILGHLPSSRQTLLFSATVPPDVRRMAETRLKKPEFITLSGDHVGALEIQHFVYLSRGDKHSELVQIIELEDPESAIIFCNTRDETKRVAAALQQQGYAADWLNADLGQSEREQVMRATREGRLRFLVATDVAARGIDISHLTHVINFDLPESSESYVHRTGRTGRAGRTGTAISLIAPGDVGNLYLIRLTYKIRPIERQLPSRRELQTRQETDLARVFVEAFGKRQVHPDDLSLARRLLSHELGEIIIANLVRDHLGDRAEASEQATAARRSRAPEATPGKRERREKDERAGRSKASRPRSAAAENGASRGSARGRLETEKLESNHAAEPRSEEPHSEKPRSEEPHSKQPRSAERHSEKPRSAERHSEEPRSEEPRRAEPRSAEPHAAGENNRPLDDTLAESTSGDEVEPTASDRPIAEIYVNVGRRDGAKPGDFHAVLDGADFAPEALEYIRVRHRHSFVGVTPETLDAALDALNGATIAGRSASAELARPRE